MHGPSCRGLQRQQAQLNPVVPNVVPEVVPAVPEVVPDAVLDAVPEVVPDADLVVPNAPEDVRIPVDNMNEFRLLVEQREDNIRIIGILPNHELLHENDLD